MNEELGKGSREKEEESRKEIMTGTQRGRSRNLVFQAGSIWTSYKANGWRWSEGSPVSEPNPKDHEELSRGTSLPLHLEGKNNFNNISQISVTEEWV